MATTRKSKKTTATDFITPYLQYALEVKKHDRNVYKFCKHFKLEEADFYKQYGSLHMLERAIWDHLMTAAIKTVAKDESYSAFSDQEKLLSLFYTFFESLTMNRSYVTNNLRENMDVRDRMTLLKPMKNTFRKFVDECFEDSPFTNQSGGIERLNDVRRRGLEEGFWTQLMFLIEFWRKDDSPGFEKTDIAIEKSVRAAMDLIVATPVRSLVDFGRFIWKERFARG